ncbi:MAG: dicarboxylate/amino acid:cation symporter [Treponema sp.]|nr:dicarboxylate/amino acid:cation symporter [Treponema sp.]
MKLWVKYLLGILLGIAAAFILPSSSEMVQSSAAYISDLAIRFGRYTLLPMLFFTVAYAMFKLRSRKMILTAGIWTVSVIVISTLVLTILGLLSILIVKLPRIPISSEKISELTTVNVAGLIQQLLPFSSFSSLQDGAYLLPAFIFASLAGAGCASDESASKPVITFIESAAKLCYSIMSFFLEFMAVAMIAVSCYWMISVRPVFAARTFLPLAVMLLVDFVIVAGVIYPLILYIFCKDRRPYRVLYASICPILTAFFSGDSNLSLLVNIKHGRDSLGIHRRINGLTFPLFSVFARGGTALVTTICFVMILRSYSSLGFTAGDVLWIFIMTFALSFVMCAIPSGGAFVSLTILCTIYSRGFEAGYLLLRPAVPVFCSFAAAFDALTAMFGSYIISVKTHTIEHIAVKHYV